MSKSKKNFQFEKSLNELEKIVETMESGELPLEKSLEEFEKGVKLTQACTQALNQAEASIKILLEQNDEIRLHDFEIDDEDED